MIFSRVKITCFFTREDIMSLVFLFTLGWDRKQDKRKTSNANVQVMSRIQKI